MAVMQNYRARKRFSIPALDYDASSRRAAAAAAAAASTSRLAIGGGGGAATGWSRRASMDSSMPRSRRGSSEIATRLEVDIKSRKFYQSANLGPNSPTPFPPCFSGDISEDLEAQVDDKVTIQCTVHGHPRPEVAWHKDGALLLQNSHGIELWSHGYEHKLVIPYVEHEHAGVYCIVAFNPLGRSECHCVVHVVDEPAAADSGVETPTTAAAHGCCAAGCRVPPELPGRLFRDQFCRAGDPVLLECEVAGLPPPLVTWSFNGQPIKSDDQRFRVSNQGQKYRLRMPRTAAGDSGRICLTAENDSGVASCAALLIVEDPTTGRICNQKVIRMATKLYNRRPEKPTEAWKSTPSYSLVA